MKDREKILKAFNYLEKTKKKSSENRFLKDCKILGEYILEAYEKRAVTRTEATLYLKQIKKYVDEIKGEKGEKAATGWYEETKIHRTLSGDMVRSKSELIIANLLYERNIPFEYEKQLYGSDGRFGPLPDFTIVWNGKEWYWEHLGMLEIEEYKSHWEVKKEWYKAHGLSKRLIITEEREGVDSKKFVEIIQKYFE
ncbi:MAG: hypothetical protein KAX04_00180 [Methanomicrobia archaeon]|nr:hypothetical protein [Methanomicrobia archaeon]